MIHTPDLPKHMSVNTDACTPLRHATVVCNRGHFIEEVMTPSSRNTGYFIIQLARCSSLLARREWVGGSCKSRVVTGGGGGATTPVMGHWVSMIRAGQSENIYAPAHDIPRVCLSVSVCQSDGDSIQKVKKKCYYYWETLYT